MTVEQPTRRKFYILITNALGAAIAAAFAIPAALYLLVKPKNAEGGDWVEVAELDQLKVGRLPGPWTGTSPKWRAGRS
jgi:hypothetical protein